MLRLLWSGKTQLSDRFEELILKYPFCLNLKQLSMSALIIRVNRRLRSRLRPQTRPTMRGRVQDSSSVRRSSVTTRTRTSAPNTMCASSATPYTRAAPVVCTSRPNCRPATGLETWSALTTSTTTETSIASITSKKVWVKRWQYINIYGKLFHVGLHSIYCINLTWISQKRVTDTSRVSWLMTEMNKSFPT